MRHNFYKTKRTVKNIFHKSSATLLFVLHNEDELGVRNFSIFVHIQLVNGFLSLLHLVSLELRGYHSDHFVLGDVTALVSVHLGELVPHLTLLSAVEGSPELGELLEVDALVAVLVSGVDEGLGLGVGHLAAHLGDKSL